MSSLMTPAFVEAPSTLEKQQLDMPQPERVAVLAAAAALIPEAAHAANNGYALQQLFSAIFVIGLGPAVLFWIYFNKPELLRLGAATKGTFVCLQNVCFLLA